MSAVLSPAEQQEVTRFGLFDEEIIAWLEENDTATCWASDAPATVSVASRCCGYSCLACDEHLERMRDVAELSESIRCRGCGVKLPTGDFNAIAKVVPL